MQPTLNTAERLLRRAADEALSLAGVATVVVAGVLRDIAYLAEKGAPALHRAAAAVGGRTAPAGADGGLTPEQVLNVRTTLAAGAAAAYLSHDWPAMTDSTATVTGRVCRRCSAVSDEDSALRACGAAGDAQEPEPGPRAPLYVPGSCPRCRGKLTQSADGGTWACGGVPDEAWARALLAGRASALPGERVTEEHVRELVGRPACGWSGAEATRGDLWS